MYNTSKHSKYLLQYHLILVTKYRHPILDSIKEEVKSIIKSMENLYNFEIKIMEVDVDHIHLMISTSPDINLKRLIMQIKKNVTYNLYKNSIIYSLLRRFYWYRNKLFSEGYFICSIGEANEETIRKYIENQG